MRDALATRNALAVAYCGGERYTEAADLLREVVEQCTERLGADDPDTLVAAGNLGVALAWMGRFDDALPLLSHVLAARERVLGDEHVDTLTARDALAVTYRLAGQVAAAVGLHAHVVEQRIRVLGPAHPHTLTSRCGLALARIAAGSAGAAANVLSAALVDAEEVPGPPTLATVVLRANLGRCLLQLERPGSAQPLLAGRWPTARRCSAPTTPTASRCAASWPGSGAKRTPLRSDPRDLHRLMVRATASPDARHPSRTACNVLGIRGKMASASSRAAERSAAGPSTRCSTWSAQTSATIHADGSSHPLRLGDDAFEGDPRPGGAQQVDRRVAFADAGRPRAPCARHRRRSPAGPPTRTSPRRGSRSTPARGG